MLPEVAAARPVFRRLALRRQVLRYAGVGGPLLVLFVLFSATQRQFLTGGNLLNILQTNAVTLVVAIGMTFVLLVAGFDLSIGGFVSLTGVLLALLFHNGVPEGLAVAIVVVGAMLAGLAGNGVPIATLGVNFFIVTLASSSLTLGLSLLITSGSTQDLYDAHFVRALGGGDLYGFPYPVIISLALLLLALYVTRYTGYGRQVYAVGGNEEAARLSGINVTAIRISAYAVSGMMSGIGGVVLAGRLGSAAPNAAIGLELTAAAAVLVGGTSFLGGSGGMFGTFLGVMFLGILQNGLTLESVSTYWQGIITGFVLLAAALMDRLRRTRLAGIA
jgi:ribose transport system permease protein